MNASTKLRSLLAQPGMQIAPGAYDAITARLIQQAGYPLVYMTGAGTSASLGYPDYGLLTLTEMVDNAAILARSVDIPVISDADTGYGNELNVTRTVREFEARGVAAIHIEDQATPKRCGHLEGKEIEPLERYLSKIRAACAARRNSDFYIIARTDSRASMGLDEAVRRANAALAEGADMAFIEAPQTLDEVVAIPKRVQGPCMLNIVQGGKTPAMDLREVAKIGYKLAILPGVLLRTAVIAFDEVLADIMQQHIVPDRLNRYSPHQSFQRFGADEWDEIRARFAQHEQSAFKAG